MSTALIYSVTHLGNLLRSPISIGSKIKSYRPDGNRMPHTVNLKLHNNYAIHCRFGLAPADICITWLNLLISWFGFLRARLWGTSSGSKHKYSDIKWSCKKNLPFWNFTIVIIISIKCLKNECLQPMFYSFKTTCQSFVWNRIMISCLGLYSTIVLWIKLTELEKMIFWSKNINF